MTKKRKLPAWATAYGTETNDSQFISAPTAEQIGRVVSREKRATYCRVCGQSDIFDGAMFTTGGGDVCDDCL